MAIAALCRTCKSAKRVYANPDECRACRMYRRRHNGAPRPMTLIARRGRKIIEDRLAAQLRPAAA